MVIYSISSLDSVSDSSLDAIAVAIVIAFPIDSVPVLVGLEEGILILFNFKFKFKFKGSWLEIAARLEMVWIICEVASTFVPFPVEAGR
jgi:hypothetical protein